MSCNCKNNSKEFLAKNGIDLDEINGKLNNENTTPLHEKIIILIAKTFGFLIGSVLISLIVVPFAIYTLFKIIYFDESVDVTGFLKEFSKKMFGKEPKQEEEVNMEDVDMSNINADEYEMVGVEDITEEVKQK